MLLPGLFSLMALMGTPAATSPYDMQIYVRDKATETVFLAPPGSAAAGALPVFRICYHSPASTPAPDLLSVHIGSERRQLLSQGKCSFFIGDQIDLAVWRADGTVRASVTMLR